MNEKKVLSHTADLCDDDDDTGISSVYLLLRILFSSESHYFCDQARSNTAVLFASCNSQQERLEECYIYVYVFLFLKNWARWGGKKEE